MHVHSMAKKCAKRLLLGSADTALQQATLHLTALADAACSKLKLFANGDHDKVGDNSLGNESLKERTGATSTKPSMPRCPMCR